ncbi:hypothetical protein CC78DRAFT_577502 [Lojkania enalia]|uniref:Uncharacterized protein n=1 Tax=Lojkania enalia TaxID=147567 RepID=A0A9P4N7P1_9PLEO|nr:hypothetical protein CC78DRAFT_577502 [Didymosphaeria enalia]
MLRRTTSWMLSKFKFDGFSTSGQFVTIVFALYWAKAGLSNIEAATLMNSRLEPTAAMHLMWHTDNKWGNPLWWPRAIRGQILAIFWRRKPSRKESISRPGTLCRSTSPSVGSLLYAPHGPEGVSETYFNDKVSRHADHIEFFAGPAVLVDGTYVTEFGLDSPFVKNHSYDLSKYDGMFNDRSYEETTTAILEFFLWESSMRLNDTYPGPIEIMDHPLTPEFPQEIVDFAGISIHCDITATVGYATLEPAQWAFSEFCTSKVASNRELNNFSSQANQHDVGAPQVLALQALARDIDNLQLNDGTVEILSETTLETGACSTEYDESWIALYTAINSGALPPGDRDWSSENSPVRQYYALTKDLQLAVYKLLGESVIQLMREGAVNPWHGSLYTFETRIYLTKGVVSWKIVLALLVLWVLLVSSGAVWIVCPAGPRWVPSLNRFEMFKFGAQHVDEAHEFLDLDFQWCESTLYRVPRMVGMLPGLAGRAISWGSSV